MADAVLSVRIDETLKGKFIELAQENGINNKDLMEVLVTQYELSQMGDGSQQFSQDIDELQRITKRMMELYLHLMERSQLKEVEIKNKESVLVKTKEEQIVKLQAEVESLLEKGKQMTTLKDEIKSVKAKWVTLSEENDNLKDMNQLLKDKNKELLKSASEHKVKLDSFEAVMSQVNVLAATIEDQKVAIRESELKLDRVEAQKKAILEKSAKDLNQLEIKGEEQRLFEEQKQNLKLNEMKLALKEEYNEQLMEVKEEYMIKIAQLMNEKETLLNRLSEKKDHES
ncbi:MAG: hypothetical protein ACRCST_17665 [Turicibacter sp.]